MTAADFATLGKTLGIPGVMILVWYLLEKQRGERQTKTEEQKIASENKKTEAMEAGFKGLSLLIIDHAQADGDGHAEMGERLAAIETHLEIRRKTPPVGIREVNRASTRDGNR